MTATADLQTTAAAADGVSLRRWFAFYALFLAAAACPLAVLLADSSWTWTWRPEQIGRQLQAMSPAIKLLAFLVYISLCCTFFPLPANPVVAALATHEAAITGELWSTVLLVGAVGAAASTIANLNDYHIFTWMLRSHRVAAVRRTRLYVLASRWFARSPFLILVVFNIAPIPVDVIRMLATTYRYPRRAFAGANFVGRFVRYSVIAFVTFWWNLGWIAVAALLAVAVALLLAKVAGSLLRRGGGNGGNTVETETFTMRESEP